MHVAIPLPWILAIFSASMSCMKHWVKNKEKNAQNWFEIIILQTCNWKIDFCIYDDLYLIVPWIIRFGAQTLIVSFLHALIMYTVVFKRRTCVWHFPTASLYSCFNPILVILWTRFYVCCNCCWFVACRRIHVNLQN